MKAVMVMFDSLRKDLLSVYGGPVPAPNFERLMNTCVRFDNCYAGSLPCMPARRELHTGRYNFLHRSWGPLEPFDDSMPAILKEKGIYTHLATDHYHYLQDGGATYQGRYSSWFCARGQESDCYIADLHLDRSGDAPNQLSPEAAGERMRVNRRAAGWQNMANREVLRTEADWPMRQTFDNGLDFLDRNHDVDRWFLQIETFDPHEPFTAPDAYKTGFCDPDSIDGPDWPQYADVRESGRDVNAMRQKYFALISFCDDMLGRVLDRFLAARNRSLTPFLECSDTSFLIRILENNRGVSLLPWYAVEQSVGQGKLSLIQVADFHVTLYRQIFSHKENSRLMVASPVARGKKGWYNEGNKRGPACCGPRAGQRHVNQSL